MNQEPGESQAQPDQHDAGPATLGAPSQPVAGAAALRKGLYTRLLGKASLIGAALVFLLFLLLLFANRDISSELKFLWIRGFPSVAWVLGAGFFFGALSVLLLGLAFRVGKVRVSYGSNDRPAQ